MTVSGTEGPEGGRQWQIMLGKTGARQTGFTKLGVMLNEVKTDPSRFQLRHWH